MAIEPGYQRRGAGSELLKSGLRVADDVKAAVSMPIKPSSRVINNDRLPLLQALKGKGYTRNILSEH